MLTVLFRPLNGLCKDAHHPKGNLVQKIGKVRLGLHSSVILI